MYHHWNAHPEAPAAFGRGFGTPWNQNWTREFTWKASPRPGFLSWGYPNAKSDLSSLKPIVFGNLLLLRNL